MKKSFWLLYLSITLVVLGACTNSTNGSSEGKPTIKIGYLPITHAVPLYIQAEMLNDRDANYQLELVKFPSWVDLMDALNTGRIDGASTLVTVAMKSKELGIDLKAVALGHRDGNALVVSNDIQHVSDLKGEKFAIPHKFSVHNILLFEMLKREGMEYEDVTPIEMSPAEMPAALATDRIAGYVVAEPFGAQSIIMGNGHVLHQSEELWEDSVDCALVLREDFIGENKELVQSFVDGYVDAGRVAETKNEGVHHISSDYMEVDEEVLDLSLKWISYDNLRLNKDAYVKLSDYLIEMELIGNPPAYEDFVDNSFIEKAR
ncbi:ABC transporter substrate-binding protein [Oceanobacillus senegalensis]|uniref:ABC transporter substrate-binding protein n=1 Tax=Oceanobacillus senegalensis TaxID=1936063 RepID=UPI000A304DD7|nr:ABC transporter substrate-binding protein [Oceanobacillus senegalensis]